MFSAIRQAQQQAYQNNTAFDQNAWKTAFDIASNFNKLSDGYTTMQDNRRKLQENFDTQEWRTKADNAKNKMIFDTAPYQTDASIAQHNTTIATEPNRANALNTGYWRQVTENNIAEQNSQADYDLAKFIGENRSTEQGFPRSIKELYHLAIDQGFDKANPLAFSKLAQEAQKFVQQDAYRMGAIDPKQAQETLNYYGTSDYRIGSDGHLEGEYYKSERPLTEEQRKQIATYGQKTAHTPANAIELAHIRAAYQNQQNALKAINSFEKEALKTFMSEADIQAGKQAIAERYGVSLNDLSTNDIPMTTAEQPSAQSTQISAQPSTQSANEIAAYYQQRINQAQTEEERQNLKLEYLNTLKYYGYVQ